MGVLRLCLGLSPKLLVLTWLLVLSMRRAIPKSQILHKKPRISVVVLLSRMFPSFRSPAVVEQDVFKPLSMQVQSKRTHPKTLEKGVCRQEAATLAVEDVGTVEVRHARSHIHQAPVDLYLHRQRNTVLMSSCRLLCHVAQRAFETAPATAWQSRQDPNRCSSSGGRGRQERRRRSQKHSSNLKTLQSWEFSKFVSFSRRKLSHQVRAAVSLLPEQVLLQCLVQGTPATANKTEQWDTYRFACGF